MLVLLDLPGDLVREMREKSAQKGRKLSNTAEECIRRSLALEDTMPSESGRLARHFPCLTVPLMRSEVR